MGITDAFSPHGPVGLHIIDSYSSHFCVDVTLVSAMVVPMALMGDVFTILPVCSSLHALYSAKAHLCQSF